MSHSRNPNQPAAGESRTKPEDERRASDERYRLLLNTIDEGFCVIEVLFDEQERPLDFRFLEVNAAFEKQTGIKDAVGRRMREIAPRHEEFWFETYGQVALGGKPARLQKPTEALGRFFDIYAFRIDDPADRHVAILFKEISVSNQAEELLQNIALFPEENPFPVLRIDRAGVLLYANRSSADLLRQWQCVVGDKAPPLVQQAVTEALNSNEGKELEIPCQDLLFSFMLMPFGERGYVNFYGRDITETKRAEQSLRESEQHYRNLFHKNHAAMLLIDPKNGKIVDANPAACDFYGYPVDVMKTMTVNAINKLSYEQLLELMQKATETPSQVFYFRHHLADGQVRDVEVFTGPLMIKGRQLLYSIIHDTTDRKRIEDALRESEQRFASFMLHLPAAAWLKDLQGRYVYCNVETERIFGTTVAALHGKTDADFLPPAIARDFRKSDEQVLTEGRLLQMTQTVAGADGEQRHYLTSKFVIPDGAGEPAYIAGIALDVTDRVRAEQEVMRLNADLEDRARELEAFNYTVAHDLRKPLTVISGYSQVLQDLAGGHQAHPQCLAALEKICDTIDNMAQLIDALLDFSRLSNVQPDLTKVDLSAMAREIAEDLKMAEPDRKVAFRIPDGIKVNADAGLARVVMNNLLHNAWKYTAGEQLAVIEFGTASPNDLLCCYVRDNGIGFAMEEAEKVFLPFQRLTFAKDTAGFGIGLSTVERIVRHHGGDVWAESSPGQGATFYFSFGSGLSD